MRVLLTGTMPDPRHGEAQAVPEPHQRFVQQGLFRTAPPGALQEHHQLPSLVKLLGQVDIQGLVQRQYADGNAGGHPVPVPSQQLIQGDAGFSAHEVQKGHVYHGQD